MFDFKSYDITIMSKISKPTFSKVKNKINLTKKEKSTNSCIFKIFSIFHHQPVLMAGLE